MPIEASSVYTKERILGLSNHVAKNGNGWIVLLVCNIVVIVCSLGILFTDSFAGEDIFGIVVIAVVDFLWLFIEIILPRVSLKKSPVLNASVNFTFNEEDYCVESQIKDGTTSTKCNYSTIKKVENRKTDVYLFVNRRQAYVVDVSSFSNEKLWIFKDLLYRKIPAQKIKWKD
ncbi:MAG: YcxB family protein [Ruminococcaceae bacterium]|nr:YcxB family protein [Oscillospiraceae bacterium]